MKDDKSCIKMGRFLKVLQKFNLKLNDKQKNIIQKIYKVSYMSDPNTINVQPIFDLKKHLK